MEIKDPLTGEILSEEDVVFAYTREGRRVIGKEYPNPVPMAPPIGFVPYEDIHEKIARMVMSQLRQEAGEDFETEEEANDFDVQDDYDPSSPWEEQFEPSDPWPPIPAREALEATEKAADGPEATDHLLEVKNAKGDHVGSVHSPGTHPSADPPKSGKP